MSKKEISETPQEENDEIKNNVVNSIIEKAKQGKNSFCFGITDGEQTYRIKINGEYKSIALPEVKEHFKAKGFTFKPTGVINGVYQMTEDICW